MKLIKLENRSTGLAYVEFNEKEMKAVDKIVMNKIDGARFDMFSEKGEKIFTDYMHNAIKKEISKQENDISEDGILGRVK